MVSLLRRLDKLLSLQVKISPKNLLKPTQVRWFDGFRNTRSIQEIKDAYDQHKRDTSGISSELKLKIGRKFSKKMLK